MAPLKFNSKDISSIKIIPKNNFEAMYKCVSNKSNEDIKGSITLKDILVFNVENNNKTNISINEDFNISTWKTNEIYITYIVGELTAVTLGKDKKSIDKYVKTKEILTISIE
jgi:hypothetical protein